MMYIYLRHGDKECGRIILMFVVYDGFNESRRRKLRWRSWRKRYDIRDITWHSSFQYRGKTDLVEINATQAYTTTGTTYYIVVGIHNAHSRLDDFGWESWIKTSYQHHPLRTHSDLQSRQRTKRQTSVHNQFDRSLYWHIVYSLFLYDCLTEEHVSNYPQNTLILMFYQGKANPL